MFDEESVLTKLFLAFGVRFKSCLDVVLSILPGVMFLFGLNEDRFPPYPLLSPIV